MFAAFRTLAEGGGIRGKKLFAITAYSYYPLRLKGRVGGINFAVHGGQKIIMEKEERIKKLQEEVQALRDLLSRVKERTSTGPSNEENNENSSRERVDILKKIRERKIIDDDIPPF